MKYVFLAIFVLFATQPVQAAPCDMHDAQGISHSQHGDMQDNNDPDTDCCDHEPLDSSDNCDSMSHCGASLASFATIDTSPATVVFVEPSLRHLANSGEPLSQFYSPPFRPPIA